MLDIIVNIRGIAVQIYKRIPGKPFLFIFKTIDNIYKKINRSRIIVVNRNRINFELELNQLIDSNIYYNGVFELATVAGYQKIVKPGMVVFDIGANVGCHALNLARLVGPQGEIYAFEPTNWAYKKLEKNLSLNKWLNNVIIERLALSDEIGFNKRYSFRSKWDVEGNSTDKEEGVINYITLDAYCEKHSISDVDFIKIDVDGYERKIIKGGMKILKKSRPVIIIEMGDYWLRSVGDNIEQLVALLNSIGYKYFSEENFLEYNDVIRFVKSLEGEKTINVICIPT